MPLALVGPRGGGNISPIRGLASGPCQSDPGGPKQSQEVPSRARPGLAKPSRAIPGPQQSRPSRAEPRRIRPSRRTRGHAGATRPQHRMFPPTRKPHGLGRMGGAGTARPGPRKQITSKLGAGSIGLAGKSTGATPTRRTRGGGNISPIPEMAPRPGRTEPSRAEPSQAEPSRAGPRNAEPSRAVPGPGQARPSRAKPSRVRPSRWKWGHTGATRPQH